MNEGSGLIRIETNESGGLSIILGDRIMDSLDKASTAIFRNPLEALKVSIEIRQMNKILSALGKTVSDVDWSQVNQIALLDILKSSKSVDPDSQPELFNYWKNLLVKFFDPKHRYEEKCIQFSKILKNLSSEEAYCLAQIHKTSKIEDKKFISDTDLLNNGNSLEILENLAEKGLLSIRISRYDGSNHVPTFIGKRVPIQPLHTLMWETERGTTRILLSNSSEEFINFINKA